MSLSPTMSFSSNDDLDLESPSTSSSSAGKAVTTTTTNSNSNNNLLLVQGLYSLYGYGRHTLWDVAKSVCLRLLSSAEHHPQPARSLKPRQSRSPPLSPHDDGPSSSPFPRRSRARHCSRSYGPSSPPRPRIFPATPSTPPRSRTRPTSPLSARPRNSIPLSPPDEPVSSPFPRTRSQITFTPRNRNPCSSTFPRTRVLLSPRFHEPTSSSQYPRIPRTYSRAASSNRNHRRQARTPPLSPRNLNPNFQEESLLQRRRQTRSHSRNRDPSPLQIDVRHDPRHAVRFDNEVKVAYY